MKPSTQQDSNPLHLDNLIYHCAIAAALQPLITLNIMYLLPEIS